MTGIVSFGAYIPFNRLPRKKLEDAFGNPTPPGNKAVANYDEDSLTMAVASSLDCISGLNRGDIKAVYFATTTAPYKEKSLSATISEAIDLSDSVRTLDFAGSLRVGSGAIWHQRFPSLSCVCGVCGGVHQSRRDGGVSELSRRLGRSASEWSGHVRRDGQADGSASARRGCRRAVQLPAHVRQTAGLRTVSGLPSRRDQLGRPGGGAAAGGSL